MSNSRIFLWNMDSSESHTNVIPKTYIYETFVDIVVFIHTGTPLSLKRACNVSYFYQPLHWRMF